MTSAPAVYAPRLKAQRLSFGARLLAALVAAGCMAALITGSRLSPDPSGVGTHTALGLQSCQFLYRTGMPCPSCGMTTSVTFLLHGKLLASLWVQPMGTVIGIGFIVAFWIGAYMTITGRPALRLLQWTPAGYYVVPLMFFAIAAWGWKIFIHWRGLDGW